MQRERRTFSSSITNTDKFLEMPIGSRLGYYEFGMRADDDGFVASPKSILRYIGVSEDDFKILVAKGFVICFESGVIVITHWNKNEQKRRDRYVGTIYQEEKSMLIENNGVYFLNVSNFPVLESENEPILIENSDVAGNSMATKSQKRVATNSMATSYRSKNESPATHNIININNINKTKDINIDNTYNTYKTYNTGKNDCYFEIDNEKYIVDKQNETFLGDFVGDFNVSLNGEIIHNCPKKDFSYYLDLINKEFLKNFNRELEIAEYINVENLVKQYNHKLIVYGLTRAIEYKKGYIGYIFRCCQKKNEEIQKAQKVFIESRKEIADEYI